MERRLNNLVVCFRFLKQKIYLILFLIAQFFSIQTQIETYQNNQHFLTQGKEALIRNVFVRSTQGVKYTQTDLFFDYDNADLGKVMRGYDPDVFDVKRLQNADVSADIKVLYITEKESEFARTKLFENVHRQLTPRYIITQLLFLPILIGMGVFILVLAIWWRDKAVDWYAFKAFWLVFIGKDEPLSAKTQEWIKTAHAYEKEGKLG